MRERFVRAFRMELRLTSRSWGYALTLVLFSLAMVTLFSSPDTVRYETAQSLLMLGVGRNATGLISLILLFMTAVSVIRSERTRFAELEMVFPTGTEIFFGRMLALVVAGMPFLLAPLGIAFAAGPFEAFLRGGTAYAGESLLTIAVSVALVCLLHMTVGIRRWMIPLLGLVWLGAAVGTVILNNNGLIVPGVSLFNFPRLGYGSYTDTWERSLQGDLPLLLNGFFVGVILLIAGAIGASISRLRLFKSSLPMMLIALAGLLLTLSSGSIYTLSVAQGNTEWRMQVDTRNTLSDMLSPAAAPYTITQYNITLELRQPSRFMVEMDVQNRSEQPLSRIDLTLNAQLEIEESSVPYERSGDFLTLALDRPLLPQATVAVRLVYGGTPRWLDLVSGAPAQMTTFINEAGLNLPPTVGWYPVAGRVSLMTGLTDRLPDQPAAVRLHVIDEGILSFASNLSMIDTTTFASAGTRWISLMGAHDLETVILAENVTLIGNRLEVAKVRDDLTALMSQARSVMDHYLIPPDITLMLPYTLSANWTMLAETPPMAEGIAIFVRSQSLQFNSHRYESSIYALTHAVLGDNGSSLLTDNVAYFFWLQMQTEGDIDAMRSHLAERQSSFLGTDADVNVTFVFPANSPSYFITEALVELYAVQGRDEVAHVLQRLQIEFNTLKEESPANVVGWMETVADEP
jgi:hypothetical protein